KKIKKEADKRDPSYRPGQYNSISSAESRLLAAKTRRCILPLRSKGCSWAFEKKGTCTICGIRGDNLWDRQITNENIMEQFKKDFEKIDFKTHSILAVYCNGSFLDDKEVNSMAKNEILKIVSKEKGVKRVDFETRPEFVTDSRIKRMKKLLGRKILEISMGFDEVDEDVRNLIVNKGMKREELEKAIKILIKNHVDTLVYVGVKPPFLTEKEAIQEAIDTIEYLFRIGVEQISLEPITVQDYTLTKYLYDKGLYRPPWLWSIIEILRAAHSKINAPMIGPERIGGFVFFPLPKVVAHNCPKCDKKVVKAIKKFESIQDIRVFDKLSCSCKRQWEREIERVEPPLYERIVKTLQKAE
ncbi:MAG: archaeosine biosynthesis radical SAM protein RaSEA, partial [Candidatus Aenigmatarchaeota archaeon]